MLLFILNSLLYSNKITVWSRVRGCSSQFITRISSIILSWGRALISMSFLRFYVSSSIVLITIYHICCYFMLVGTSFPHVIDGTLKGRVGNVEASYLWKHKIPPFLKITLQNHTSSKTHECVQADQCLTGNVMKDGKAALSDYLVSFTGEKTLQDKVHNITIITPSILALSSIAWWNALMVYHFCVNGGCEETFQPA